MASLGPQEAASLSRARSAERGERGAGHEPAGVPEPHLIGHEHEDGAGLRPFAQPEEPLGEGRPVGGCSLPNDEERAPAWEEQGGVLGRSPVPPQTYGIGDVGDG